MPTRRIDDNFVEEQFVCCSPDHNPPGFQVFEPGLYEHVCSGCGAKYLFRVEKPELRKDYFWDIA